MVVYCIARVPKGTSNRGQQTHGKNRLVMTLEIPNV